MKGTVRIVLGGDVMLGRLVKEKIQRFGPEYPLGKITATTKQAALILVNLECAITSSER